MIERRFCQMQQWRGVATKEDKLSLMYRAAVVVYAVIAWTQHSRDKP